MNDEYKSATCKDCRHRVGSECRRHPPMIFSLTDDLIGQAYPTVEFTEEERWNDACAEYQREDGA
jgi:hypothetical protein